MTRNEKAKAYQKLRRETCPDEVREYNRILRLAFPERRLAEKRRSYQKHRASNLHKRREYVQRNHAQVLARNKVWQDRNREQCRATRRDYKKRRSASDPAFRMSCALRARLGHAIRRARARKSTNTFALVGCSAAQLLKHLADQFESGMSWANYGTWEVDHIKACAEFNLIDPDEQRKCFHFSNLRPLWRKENRARANKPKQ